MSQGTARSMSCKVPPLPTLKFETQRLSSFSGLVLIQALFARYGLWERLRRMFRGKGAGPYRFEKIFLLLIVHLMLGFRRLRDADSYRHDPLVRQVVGLKRLPDVSTISRRLKARGPGDVQKAVAGNRELVIEGLRAFPLKRYTMDFDGSVLSTRRQAEGSAVGFNRKRKGARSYYPLLCTVAQSAQVFGLLHRPGNVHDSNGAAPFMAECLGAFAQAFPHAQLESRADSAFFNEQIVDGYEQLGVEFSLSVPFERFPELKGLIEERKRWKRATEGVEYFELQWKPACWERKRVRLIAVRQRQGKQRKGPLQLDFFEPLDYEHQYSVVATNKSASAASVIDFHHGRGSQEGLIGELKEDLNLDYIPCRKLAANQLYMVATVWAHNLLRLLQMQRAPQRTNRQWKRPACWIFEKTHTLRTTLLHRAGRLTAPKNRPVLTISGDNRTQQQYDAVLSDLRHAA